MQRNDAACFRVGEIGREGNIARGKQFLTHQLSSLYSRLIRVQITTVLHSLSFKFLPISFFFFFEKFQFQQGKAIPNYFRPLIHAFNNTFVNRSGFCDEISWLIFLVSLILDDDSQKEGERRGDSTTLLYFSSFHERERIARVGKISV